jgi:hypothetical protein
MTVATPRTVRRSELASRLVHMFGESAPHDPYG